ncbi:29303_t:CDS:2, partial [Gigaspora margarita]
GSLKKSKNNPLNSRYGDARYNRRFFDTIERKVDEGPYSQNSERLASEDDQEKISIHEKIWENQSLEQLDIINIQAESHENLTTDNAQQSSHMKQDKEKKISDKDDKMDTELNSTGKDHNTNQTGHSNLTLLSNIKFSHDNPYLNKKVNTNTNEKNQENQCLKQADSIISEDINDQEDKMDIESISTIEDKEIKDEPKKKTYSKILKANETKQKSKRRYTTISDWLNKVKLKIDEQKKAERVEVFDSRKWEYNKILVALEEVEGSGSKKRIPVEIDRIKKDLKELAENCAANKRVCRSGNDDKDKNKDDWALTNSIYRIYTANYNRLEGRKNLAIIGAALAVHRDLCLYIHNIQTVAGTMETERVLKEWTLLAKRNLIQLIMMGDYNTNKKRKQNKGSVLMILETRGLVSLLDFQRILHPTWQRGELRNQIDDFWVDAELALNIDIVEMIEPKTITESDHMILKTTWHAEINLGTKQPKPVHRREIFMYEKMVKEDWET